MLALLIPGVGMGGSSGAIPLSFDDTFPEFIVDYSVRPVHYHQVVSGSYASVPYRFVDNQLSPRTLSALRYRVDDIDRMTEVLDWTTVSPASGSGVITVPASLNETSRSKAMRQVTVQGLDSGGSSYVVTGYYQITRALRMPPVLPYSRIKATAWSVLSLPYQSVDDSLSAVTLATDGIRYRIDDLTNGVQVLGWTTITGSPPASSGEISIPANLNAMNDSSNDKQLNQVLVEFTDTNGNVKQVQYYYELAAVYVA